MRLRLLLVLAAAVSATVPALPQGGGGSGPDPAVVRAGMRRAAEFFHREVSVQGSYLWAYSDDLLLREGEGRATRTQGWIQPPGTPAVGLAFLDAHQATGDGWYLEPIRATVDALAKAQLRSGGWTYSVDFDPAQRDRYAYREGGGRRGRNTSTLDDDTTQCALRFLARAEQALQFRDDRARRTARSAWDAVLAVQYPNGAWPQGFVDPPDPAKHPVLPASFPREWSRTWPGSQDYWFRYTLNDNALATMVDTLYLAAAVYSRPEAGPEGKALADRCRRAGTRAGEFLIRAQLPDPQPGWAQQYDFEMHPAWARRFEPPAVSGLESQGAIRALLRIYEETGERRFLEPIPRALEWLRRSRLPDGRLARFYELRTNRPLYMTRQYELTYEPNDLPTHYGFQVPSQLDRLTAEYEEVRRTDVAELRRRRAAPPAMTARLRSEAAAVLAALDGRGRWVEAGALRFHPRTDPPHRAIRAETFSRNMGTLARYLTAAGSR